MSESFSSLPARLQKKIQIDSAGCWVWTGKRTKRYGLAYVGRRNGKEVWRAAHAVVYEAIHGPLPDGLECDHLCRFGFCVNPDHMEPVTHLENVRRGDSGRRQRERTHCPCGHAFDEVNTYARPDGARGCKACRKEAVARHWKKFPERRRAANRKQYERIRG